MIVTWFDNLRYLTGVALTETWEGFVASMTPTVHQGPKNDLPLFSPAEFNGPRLPSKVIRIHFGVLDFDGLSLGGVSKVFKALEGLDAILVPTWSNHGRSGYYLRACVRLSRPIEVAEWADFRPWFVSRIGGLADPQCNDPSRIYFGPFYPEAAQGCRCVTESVFSGKALDVDQRGFPDDAGPWEG